MESGQKAGHKVIKHYIIKKTLGVGSFAEVKLAVHEITGAEVAIKIFSKKVIRQKKSSARVRREIALLRFLKHQNIIRLYEVMDTTHQIYIVLELVEGVLENLIEEHQSLDEPHALHIFRQIVSGLEYCHKYQVVHRDLKPPNILIDKRGCVKITDFGLSNKMTDGAYLTTSCGSLAFAAPEVIEEGALYEGTNVDVWSCGVILYQMVAGENPFENTESTRKIYRKIKNGEYDIPEKFSPPLADLIRRMIVVDPLKRASIREVRQHPWMQPSAISEWLIPALEFSNHSEINDKLFEHLLTLKLDFHGLRKEKIRRAIKRKERYTFVVVYNLLADISSSESVLPPLRRMKSRSLIFGDILSASEYVPKAPSHADRGPWSYGKTFRASAKGLLEMVISILHFDGLTIVEKSPNFRLKCVLRRAGKERMEEEALGGEDSDQTQEQEEGEFANIDKYSRAEMAFQVQVYSVPGKMDHLLDLYLLRGHPLLFLNLCNRVYSRLEAKFFSS